MKLSTIGVALTLACGAGSALAYTIKTYHGVGASKIEACTLAKQAAESPDEEVAHGRLIKVSACNCTVTSKPGAPRQWSCLVQSTHDR
ncbi:hypothetical protein [Paraburkholderia sp. BCC1884]|uniref:hypothetical protein n=1 Tax=Paraburkholderia sp. BCC1884 TaxID=2562668 RepID=UPI001182F66D|nr:hypothetical protein [Paraburkholderia sp. BCC1884]